MENKKQLLEQLKKRNEKLKPLVFKSFKTKKELDKYSKTIQTEIEEYYNTQEQIQKLKWDLMTPEEQSKKLKEREISKLKRDGKL